MLKHTLLSLLIGALVGGGLVLWRANNNELTSQDSTNLESSRDSRMPYEHSQQMAPMQQMFVTSERSFVENMIPHHQEAVDTAREVLERGGSTEEIQNLMNSIITAQTAEIDLMREWYREWYGETYKDSNVYEPMMRELESLSGATLDRVFLEDMIMHHMGAIMMARSVQPYVEHTEIATLTQNIVVTQSAEIAQMRQILEAL